MLDVIHEHGYAGVSMSRLVADARVSSGTFYACFANCEDCFAATFDECVEQIVVTMRDAYRHPGPWPGRVRAALVSLLELLDRDRALATLVFVESPRVGAALHARRSRVVELIRIMLDAGHAESDGARVLPDLTSEVVVEGVIAAIRARVRLREERTLMTLIEPLMGVIAHSYLDHSAPAWASDLHAPLLPAGGSQTPAATDRDLLESIPIRITHRTARALAAIAQCPAATSRAIGDAAGVADAAQISRLLARLESAGLIRNDGDAVRGARKQWRLTTRGGRVEQAIRAELA